MFVDYKEVGRRIAVRRKELGLKQAAVCEKAELSDKYLSNIERATSIMSIDVLMRICGVLDTTPDQLLLGTAKDGDGKGYGKYISDKTEDFSQGKREILNSFIDWLSQQKNI